MKYAKRAKLDSLIGHIGLKVKVLKCNSENPFSSGVKYVGTTGKISRVEAGDEIHLEGIEDWYFYWSELEIINED